MKKNTSILVVLLIAAPAMSAVSISITDNADLTAEISYNDDGEPNYVLAFALDITVDNDANITGVTTATSGDGNSTEQDYDIFLVSFRKIDAGGVTIEMVSLAEDANSPPLSAPLCTVTVDKACNMTVSVNADGGGVVLEDANSITPDLAGAQGVSITACDDCCGDCICMGDMNGDNWLTLADLYALIGRFNVAGPPYQIPSTSPLYDECADMNCDGWLMLADLYALIGKFSFAWPLYQIQCGQDPIL